MGKNVCDHIIERLRAYGVSRIFGYPGDGINGFFAALQRADGDPEFILARHEELAALMACGHAKFTGELGVCCATQGPGAIHLLNGLYDAKLDHQPVLAIVGQQARSAWGGAYQQEVDLSDLFKDVAGAYLHTVAVPEQLPGVVDRAVRIALTRRTVTCLILPNDVQELSGPELPPHQHFHFPGSFGAPRCRVLPQDQDLERAAALLNEGKRVAILIGQGARGAADEVVQVADRLGAGVAKALLGKDVLPDTLPFVTGAIGLLGTRPSWDMMMECDTLLVVGSNLPYSEFFPEWGKAKGVQIDLSSSLIGIRYPMDVLLVGDARETLQALLPKLQPKQDRSWRDIIVQSIADWWRTVEERAMMEAEPLNPQRLFWELNRLLPDDCIITCDSGSSANWFARDLQIRQGMRCSLSGTLATMGCSVPYALAAKLAYPERPVIALVGDGAFQMNGMNGLITLAQHAKAWKDPRLVIQVLHNGDLNQVTWEQRVMGGFRRFAASQDIYDFPYARYAELLGFEGIRVDRPEDVRSAWERALTADRPVVIDAVTDPNVPPLPPHITLEEAKQLTSALAKGEPDAIKILRLSFLGKLKEVFPKKP